MQPNKEVIKRWVEALRSDEYRQGTCCLRNSNDEFCCLGVLCDLAEKEKVIGEPIQDVDGLWDYGGEETEHYILPDVVVKWAGFTTCSPMATEEESLVKLNDAGKTFAELADLIEAKYLN